MGACVLSGFTSASLALSLSVGSDLTTSVTGPTCASVCLQVPGSLLCLWPKGRLLGPEKSLEGQSGEKLGEKRQESQRERQDSGDA